MKTVVIESPYAGNVTENVEYAKDCMRDCLKRGEAPYASHLLLTQVLDDRDTKQRELGLKAGFVWGQSADLVAVYADRGVSAGMLRGMREASKRGTPIEVRFIEIPEEIDHYSFAHNP